MKKYSREWWESLRPERVGKETEAIVEKLFKEWNSSQSFAWHRMPDAKSSMGMTAAQPADYLYRHGCFAGFLEVKALKHPYRLPRDRVSQLPTLLKWNLAGSSDLVLVFHYLEDQWRVVRPIELDPGATSWDLRMYDTFATAEEALVSTGYFGEECGM